MKTYGVIMAGGGGTRFWPLSTKELPKQFLNLSGKDCMINETFDRLVGIANPEDIFVVTNETQVELVHQFAENRFLEDHILAESAARNTAACIGYAAMEILVKHGDGVMCVVPSDHFIKDLDGFHGVLEQGISIAKDTNQLVTIGIHPTFPATGYGYIQCGEEGEDHSFQVQEFVEKPDIETAKSYLESGEYVWNSGMFLWKASTILEEFKRLLPDVYECLLMIKEAYGKVDESERIAEIYKTIPKISIDYGIMERAKEVVVLRGDFGWNDVGSYDALGAILPMDEAGNNTFGNTILLDTTDCIAYTTDKLIATIGISNLIIAQTKDAVLVCHKEDAQSVKKVVDILEGI